MVFKPKVNTGEIKKIVIDYKKALEGAGYPVEKIVLFGSYSRGHVHDWSDIDLLVVSNLFQNKQNFNEKVSVNVIANEISPLIEAHPVSSKDFLRPESPWLIEAKKYGKVLI